MKTISVETVAHKISYEYYSFKGNRHFFGIVRAILVTSKVVWEDYLLVSQLCLNLRKQKPGFRV